jgi:hypothetical protein
VQIGGAAFRLRASALSAEFLQAGALQKLLLRYVFARVAQGSPLGVCSRSHPIEQRLCRLLSRIFACVSGDEVALTKSGSRSCSACARCQSQTPRGICEQRALSTTSAAGFASSVGRSCRNERAHAPKSSGARLNR